MPDNPSRSVAEWVARFLVARGVDRIYGLQGGHIQPIWDWLHRLGVRIVDVRDEGAAVHMAHAHAALGGPAGVGVAMATAGPGVTTLPIWIYQNLFRPNNAPIVNVVAAFLVLVSILPVYIAQKFSNADERGGGII